MTDDWRTQCWRVARAFKHHEDDEGAVPEGYFHGWKAGVVYPDYEKCSDMAVALIDELSQTYGMRIIFHIENGVRTVILEDRWTCDEVVRGEGRTLIRAVVEAAHQLGVT